ncbi:hypothetical protein GRF29_185g518668 [Pseudopithomyces chartarum]|uniref:Uncharacterized protein n=1 Tax=Pseudopithomyces chartarum TaxID=1892770 RepID=A0AAN6RD84_9PLEO|nr:hypothetical protein GRF29_185g518668 [Pseudopithomyces chartarum]
MNICYDQPKAVELPRAEPTSPRPATTHSVSRHVSQWVATSRDFASRASSRTSVHTLTRPRKSHSKIRRLSISGPTDFRHDSGYDGAEGMQSMLDDASEPIRRRRSFRPLELSIYLPDGRLSPLPDFGYDEWGEMPQVPAEAFVRNRDSRTNSITLDPATSSYLVQRKPVGSGSRRSSVQSTQSVQSRPLSVTLSSLPLLQQEHKSQAESVRSITPSGLQRRGTLSPPRMLSRLPSPSRARSNTAPSRPASLRRVKTDVDEAIRELNTIVEERRADAFRSRNQSPAFTNRPPPSPSSHVPAIAPLLRMHVRSETLSDIGSAFSVPLATKPLPPPPPPPVPGRLPRRLTLAPPSRNFSGPLDSNPITPPTPTVPTPTTPIHRLGAWIKRSLPNTPSLKSPASTSTSKPSTPKSAGSRSFYQCEAQPPLPLSSRPSSAGSRTIVHSRHTSAETATVTLMSTSSYPSTPSLSSSPRHSPHSSIHSIRSIRSVKMLSSSPPPDKHPLERESLAAPVRVSLLKGNGKTRRVPAPLVLAKEKEMLVEASLGSARSIASMSSRSSRVSELRRGRESLKPPPSPNYGILRGMEIGARQEGVSQHLGMLPSPGAVGVAF